MRSIAFLVLLISVAFARKAHICEVEIEVGSLETPLVRLGSSSHPWSSFNFISFNDFYAPSGDVEGRAAIRNKLNLPTGDYSFGEMLNNDGIGAKDSKLPYALVVGGNADYASGRVYPDGDINIGNNAANQPEFIYVGGSFTGANDLLGRRSGNNDLAATLNDDFIGAQTYYNALSEALASMSSNLVMTRLWGSGLTATCSSSEPRTWVISIEAALLSETTYYEITNCHADSNFIFNVGGTGDLTFKGNHFQTGMPERIIFNVLGSGKTIHIETRVHGTIIAPYNFYSQIGMGVVVGQVIVANAIQVHQVNRLTCRTSPDEPEYVPCVGFETECTGLDVTLSNVRFSLKDFNAIVFGDFVANTGDTEGRIAAQGNVRFGNGYSVGAELSTFNNVPDRSLPFSLIVGGNLNWGDGSLHPSGNGFPNAGVRENAYVVGTVQVPSHFESDRIVRGSDLTSVFTAAKTCYKGYSETLAALTPTVDTQIYWSGLFISCRSDTAFEYILQLTPAQLTQFTYVVPDRCNFQARWTINIIGDGDVTFTGDSFPFIPGGVVYNVPGVKNINVHDTKLAGHLLAPDANLNQPSGVIVGKVVVASVQASLQINTMTTCPDILSIVRVLIANSEANAGDFSIEIVSGATNVVVGDETTLGRVTAINGDRITFDTAFPNAIHRGTQAGTVPIASNDSRMQVANEEDSSASFMGVTIAAFAFAALLI